MLPRRLSTDSSPPVRYEREDFYNFDLIIGMDDRNIDDLKEKAPSMEEWKKDSPYDGSIVPVFLPMSPDPYYGGAGSDLRDVLMCSEDACAGLLTSF